ncbi:MAG: hypothetical protein AAF639_08770 [Chloroflexota bacterium]
MIYLIGGAPRVGKTTLTQRVAANLGIGWISTDLLMEQLRVMNVEGIKTKWDADPTAITAAADWFYPCLERFVWGVQSLADSYVIEGVDFLPAHVGQLAAKYPVSAVFLGCTTMTRTRFDQFPGCSKGYANLPDEMKDQIVHDVPLWSAFIQQEAERAGYPYVDMSDYFHARLWEAENILKGDRNQ